MKAPGWRAIRAAICPECIDGWVPGEWGVERCDTCARFTDDDAAAAHVCEIIRTLVSNYEKHEHEPLEAIIARAVRDDA